MTRPLCLDLTRLISRQGRGPLTGVDRVELAYLRALLEDTRPCYLLVRTWLGYLLLDQTGAEQVLARLEGRTRWGPVDTLGRLQRKAHPAKRRAEADLRRLSIARAPKSRLKNMLRRVFAEGATYINVGHSNLTEEVLSSWKRLENGKVVVLVHDMIPLDFPEFQREGTVDLFEARMRLVAQHATDVICISEDTKRRVRHWFGAWGHEVPATVAPLGVEVARPDPQALPTHLPPSSPYFVSVGTIEPRKNHALLLDIWEQLTEEIKEPPTLVIAGARGWRNDALFQQLDMKPPNVIEAPGLSDPALSALLAGAAGALFPSRAEGFGLPPSEALLLGTPVICSDLPVLRETVGNSSIYADADDIYAWKKSILQLAGQFEAKQTAGAERIPFEASSWADHFNLVLKVL